MKKIIVLTIMMVLLLSVFVSASEGYCGDYICDKMYENCENCPQDCGPCYEQEDSFNVFDMLIGFGVSSNILKNKVLFILRVIKDQVFQTELKLIEKTLTENSCENLPVSFMVSKNDYVYGKLEEIDAMLNELLRVVSEAPAAYGIPEGNIYSAEAFLDTVNAPWATPRESLNCLWWTNYALTSQTEVSIEDAYESQTCECPVS